MPATPMKIVPRHPNGLAPGSSNRASAPTIRPAIRYSRGPMRPGYLRSPWPRPEPGCSLSAEATSRWGGQMKHVVIALVAASIVGIAAPAVAAPEFPEQPTENAPHGTQTACDANLQQ